jgi:hypothetical protein
MKMYIAGSYDERDLIRVMAELAEQQGHTITRKWWEFEGGDKAYTREQLAELAVGDYFGVVDCDVFVYINGGHKSEGKAVELGVALGIRISMEATGYEAPEPLIYVVGTKSTNIFHNMPQCVFKSNFRDVLVELNILQAPLNRGTNAEAGDTGQGTAEDVRAD